MFIVKTGCFVSFLLLQLHLLVECLIFILKKFIGVIIMRSLVVTPAQPNSVRLVELPKPSIKDIFTGRGVLVKVLQVGIDGTDKEITQGLYGEAPQDNNFLVIGHESLGVIEEVGNNVHELKPGDLVVATVRRPGNCVNCRAGQSDMCLDGIYQERGIKGLHGFISEYYLEQPEFLIKIPLQYKDIAVLTEPLSIVEKAIFQAYKIQERMLWQPARTLITGAGTIGLLAALLLRAVYHLEVHVVSLESETSFRVQWLNSIGASYHPAQTFNIAKAEDTLGQIDLIIEATGSPQAIFSAIESLGINGVMILLGISSGNQQISIPGNQINLNLVLGNRIIFGSVNANRNYFEMGVEHFSLFEQQFPGTLQKLITRQIDLNNFQSAFTKATDDIKTVLKISTLQYAEFSKAICL